MAAEGTLMKVTTWAVLGSLLLTVLLGMLMAAVGAAAPAYGCSGAHSAVHASQSTARPAAAAPGHHGSLVAVRMGWAAG
jgi:hypothetical protein